MSSASNNKGTRKSPRNKEEKGDPNKVENHFSYQVWNFVPPEAINNSNYTLTLEIEQDQKVLAAKELFKVFKVLNSQSNNIMPSVCVCVCVSP